MGLLYPNTPYNPNNEKTIGPFPGFWNGMYSPTPDGSKFDSDVNDMQESWWIDERTRLAQFQCRGLNANNHQGFLFVYSLEISAAGLFNPMPPQIGSEILNRDFADVYSVVNPLLIFAFYYLNEEIYEIYMYKPNPNPNPNPNWRRSMRSTCAIS